MKKKITLIQMNLERLAKGKMNFSRFAKRFVAMFLIMSFFWLLELSSLPLGAEPAPAKAPVSVSGDNQTPGSFEQEGGGNVIKKKRSPLLPIIIGVIAVGAIAAVLILVVFKSKQEYDITGNWIYSERYPNISFTYKATFTGDKKSGTVVSPDEYGVIFTGPYTVDGKKVSFYLIDPEHPNIEQWTYTGEFTAKDKMSGTGIDTAPGFTPLEFFWCAVKQTSAAAPVAQNLGNKHNQRRKNIPR